MAHNSTLPGVVWQPTEDSVGNTSDHEAETEPEEPRSALICHHDPARRSMAARAAEAAGLENVGEVSLVTEVFAMVPLVHPDVILLDRRSAGFLGVKTLKDLAEVAPRAALVMMNDDPSGAASLSEAGATAVAVDGDRTDVEAALERAVRSLDAEHGIGQGRRSGEDRRKVQDWRKVTRERRAAERRRSPDRRNETREGMKDDSPTGLSSDSSEKSESANATDAGSPVGRKPEK